MRKISEKTKSILLGVITSNLFAVIMLMLTNYVVKHKIGHGEIFILSDFIVLPILIGLINTIFWRKHPVTMGQCFLYGFINLVVGLAVSFLFMGEGVICLIIVSPLIFMFLLLGILLGKIIFKRKNKNRLNISVFAALLVIVAFDAFTAAPIQAKVSDEIVIHARPEQIWNHVVAFPRIEDKPEYWLFKAGLPYPVQSTVEGYYVGSDRKCIFSNGIVFDEKIVKYEPNQNLVFDIVEQPNDPEILGHILITKGQFILHDNGDGTTTLEGNSWYQLNVKPGIYFNYWSENIVRHVHLRVMQHIKVLSEKEI